MLGQLAHWFSYISYSFWFWFFSAQIFSFSSTLTETQAQSREDSQAHEIRVPANLIVTHWPEGTSFKLFVWRGNGLGTPYDPLCLSSLMFSCCLHWVEITLGWLMPTLAKHLTGYWVHIPLAKHSLLQLVSKNSKLLCMMGRHTNWALWSLSFSAT